MSDEPAACRVQHRLLSPPQKTRYPIFFASISRLLRLVCALRYRESLLLMATAGAFIPFAEAVAATPGLPAIQSFRIGKAGNPIVVPVEIASRRYRFLFDTGSAVTSVNTSLKHLLGRATHIERLYTPIDRDPTEVQLFRAPELLLGPRPLRSVSEVMCVDYRERGLVIDGEILDGWLGMDAIWNMIVRIDFDRGELSLLPSVPNDAGQSVPLVEYRSTPSVRVRLGSETVQYAEAPRFVLDTGDMAPQSGTLYSPVFQSMLHYRLLSDVEWSEHITLIAKTQARDARMAQFRLGDFEHRGLIFVEGSVNSLSLDYLSRYLVTFDFPGMKMYLSPGARYAAPDRRDLSGLHWRSVNGQIMIKRVDRGSAAAAAGLRVGDIIVRIDGAAAHTLTSVEMQRILSTPSKRSLTVYRGKSAIQLPLELSQRLRPGPPREDRK